MSDRLAQLYAEGVLSPLDWHLARMLGRVGEETDESVLLAVALVSRQLTAGHVCLQLDATWMERAGLAPGSVEVPSVVQWLERLRQSPLVVPAAQALEVKRPLVVDECGRLYLHRYWQHEASLLAYLRSASASEPSPLNEVLLSEGLDRLFGDSRSGEVDWQRQAALMAVRRKFSVISGGPGTGKTSTVVKILALLVEQAQARGGPAPQIVLMAPTGKAAARLEASIRGAKAKLPCTQAVQDQIVDKAATVHRCLGTVRGSSAFLHNRANPLVADVVLVDEASMVNLSLMRQLVDALAPTARLLLLGDMDQLASVEAGAVLGDICNTGADTLPSTPGIESASLPPIAHCVVKLRKSYRYAEGSGIAELARAINAGDCSKALDVLKNAPDVDWHEPLERGALSEPLRRAVVQGYRPALVQQSPAQRLLAFDQFRVLCARRTGLYGIDALNERIATALAGEGLIARSSQSEHYAGRPVLVTANDYELRLYNGDIGMVCGSAEGDPLRTYFVQPDGSERHFAPARLAHQQTVFAMSVHKSQGSEFDEVAIVLPVAPSAVLTRELLYTAVTRAKRSVAIFASAEVIRRCIGARVQRQSGLRAALWESGT